MKSKNALYIMIALLTTVAMVFGMIGCDAKEKGGGSAKIEDLSKPLASTPYEQLERSLFQKGVNGYASALSAVDSATSGAELIFTFTPEQYILNLLADMGAGVDTLNPTVLELRSATSGSDMFTGLTYKNGSKEILSLDYWLSANGIIMSLPQILDKYLSLDASDLDGFDFAGMAGMSDVMSSLTDSLEFSSVMPPEDALDEVIQATLNEFFELVKDTTTVSKEVALEIKHDGDTISVIVDKSVVEISLETAIKTALVFFKSIQNSDEIKDFVEEYIQELMSQYGSGYSSYSYYSVGGDFEDALAEVIEGFEAMLDSNHFDLSDVMNMTVYIRGDSIIKREFSAPGEDDVITIVTFDANGKYVTEVAVEGPGGTIRYSNVGVRKGKSSDGKMEVELKSGYDTMKLTAVYKDLEVDDSGDIVKGSITISTGDLSSFGNSGGIKSAEIILNFRKDNFVGSLVVDGVKFATVELGYNLNYTGKAAPSLNASNSVTPDGLLDNIGGIMESLSDLSQNLSSDGAFDALGIMLSGVLMMMNAMF